MPHRRTSKHTSERLRHAQRLTLVVQAFLQCVCMSAPLVLHPLLEVEEEPAETLFDTKEALLLASKRSLARWFREPVVKSGEWWRVCVPAMSDYRFRRNFRVPREVARTLYSKLQSLPEFQRKKNSPTKEPVDVARALCMTLYRLGSNRSNFDIAERFGVSEGYVYKWIDAVLGAIESHFTHVITDRFPDTPAKQMAAASAFKTLSSRNGDFTTTFDHCIGVIDGTHIPIIRPRHVPSTFTFSKDQCHALAVTVSTLNAAHCQHQTALISFAYCRVLWMRKGAS